MRTYNAAFRLLPDTGNAFCNWSRGDKSPFALLLNTHFPDIV
jgi:hypothetical protein